jgi:chemotaxis protein CheX
MEMQELPRERVVAATHASMETVFSTMLGVAAEPDTSQLEMGGAMETFNGVMAWVGIAGKWTGTGRLLVSPRMACILAGHLLMSTFDSVDEEVLDAVAEIANMVVGNVKNVLEEDLGQLCLSVPTVIYGKNYMTRSGKVQDWLVIPFQCLGESIEFRFCLMPAPTNPRAGFRIEVHHL